MGKWDSSMIHEYNTLWYTIRVFIICTIYSHNTRKTHIRVHKKMGKILQLVFRNVLYLCTMYVIRWCYRWKNTFFFGLREEHPAWTIIGFCLDAKTKTIGGSLSGYLELDFSIDYVFVNIEFSTLSYIFFAAGCFRSFDGILCMADFVNC